MPSTHDIKNESEPGDAGVLGDGVTRAIRACQCEGKGRDDLQFPGRNGLPAAVALDHRLVPGDTRPRWAFLGTLPKTCVTLHTTAGLDAPVASLAVSSGANVTAVQRMLGYVSAAKLSTPTRTSSLTTQWPSRRPAMARRPCRAWVFCGRARGQLSEA